MPPDDREFGSELRKRQTPQMAARQRRTTFRALLFGLAVSVGVIADALYAAFHGGMVKGGARNGFLAIPWWASAAIGALLLAGCVYSLRRHFADRD